MEDKKELQDPPSPSSPDFDAYIEEARHWSRERFHEEMNKIIMNEPPIVNQPDPNDPKVIEHTRLVHSELAKKALRTYKEEKGVDFELSEVTAGANTVCRASYGFHINFDAIPCSDGVDDRSPKRFFAELFCFFFGPNKRSTWVTVCAILDPFSSDVIKGCNTCSERVLHTKVEKYFCCPPELLRVTKASVGRITSGVCEVCQKPYYGEFSSDDCVI